MSVEQNVLQYLRNKGISQRHVARETGIKASTLNATLNGNRRMQINELVLICRTIEKDPSFFLNSAS